MTAIGFIGLGTMGRPIASHLLKHGHDLTVFDVNDDAVAALADAGATPGDSGADAVERSDVVILSLPGPDAVTELVDETASAFCDGTCLIDTTTSLPATTERIADRLADHGVDVLGAPVSGGGSGARDGTLSVMVGGDRDVFDRHRSVFDPFATDVFYVGEAPGYGHAAKVLNNYLSFIALLASSEAMALGTAVGLDRETLVDIFNASSGRNTATEDKIPNFVLSESYDHGFHLAGMEKDVRLYSELADAHDARIMLGDLTRNMIGYACEDRGGDADLSRLYDYIVEMTLSE